MSKRHDPDRNVPLVNQADELAGRDYQRSTGSDYHQQYDGNSEDWQPVQTDGDILNAINLVLRQYEPEFDFDLRIDVERGVVSLGGDVNSPAGIAQITQAIQAVDGVVRVENNLT